MLKLDEKVRDQVVNYLKGLTVPALVGADLIKICEALNSLEKTEEAVTPEVVSVATPEEANV